jgi:hypothetical protein
MLPTNKTKKKQPTKQKNKENTKWVLVEALNNQIDRKIFKNQEDGEEKSREIIIIIIIIIIK